MRAVIQRTNGAEITINGEETRTAEAGVVVFICAMQGDTDAQAEFLAQKICELRIFKDENGKTNLDLHSVGGELLLISQFTLYADCKKGNRPSFINAANPEKANTLYEYIISECSKHFRTEKGVFGADMKVELLNDGPFTVMLDSDII